MALIHKMAKASPLKRESQGLVLPVVPCRSPFNSCVLCACGLHLQQILDADGWALVVVGSTRCCLIFLLADAYDMESASLLKRMLYFHIYTFTGTSLACCKLVCF